MVVGVAQSRLRVTPPTDWLLGSARSSGQIVVRGAWLLISLPHVWLVGRTIEHLEPAGASRSTHPSSGRGSHERGWSHWWFGRMACATPLPVDHGPSARESCCVAPRPIAIMSASLAQPRIESPRQQRRQPERRTTDVGNGQSTLAARLRRAFANQGVGNQQQGVEPRRTRRARR